jgi:hypothetical protein
MRQKLQEIAMNIDGRVGPPMLLWFLGVPGSICLALWLFVWRG